MTERTLLILKPDALERGLERVAFEEIRRLGIMIGDVSVRRLDAEEVRAHYAKYVGEPFFPKIEAYMTRDVCAVCVCEGEDAVAKLRALAGATRPDEAAEDSLRGRFGRVTEDGCIENVLHCSATREEAEEEILRFFGPRA